MMKMIRWMLPWLIALAIVLLRATCRIRLHGDPRPDLRARSQPYVFAVLHAHQVAMIMGGEPGTGAMVSHSADGGLLIPSLRARKIVPVRGSSGSGGQDRGGRTALDALIKHVRGGSPAFLTVDGPRGPRNRVHRGIAVLSQRTGAAVLNIVAIPTRRWIFSRAWDRFQVPKPFTTIHGYFGEPLIPRQDEDVEQYCARIESELNELERRCDPVEAERARAAVPR